MSVRECRLVKRRSVQYPEAKRRGWRREGAERRPGVERRPEHDGGGGKKGAAPDLRFGYDDEQDGSDLL
jgi:hypothetical protein